MHRPDSFHKLTQFDIYDNTGETAGAYGLYNLEGQLLYLDWTESLAMTLMKHLPVNERNANLRGKAKAFKIFTCETQSEFVEVFDKIIEHLGKLPVITDTIPEGSKYAGKDKAATEVQIEALVAKARALFKNENISEAYELMSSAAESGNGVSEYHLFMGQLEAVKGFLDAVSQFEKAAESDPVSPVGIQAAALAERCCDLLVGFKKL